MQQGQYILDRWVVDTIRTICRSKNISFASYSDDWILELSRDNFTSRVFGYKFGLNDAASTAIAGDKVATYEVLQAHNVPAVEHRLVRTKASQNSGWEKGLNQVVVKPLEGTSGHGIRLLSSVTQVSEYIEQHPYIAAWAVAPYEAIQTERRFILLDGKILMQYEKIPVTVNGLPMFNLGLGATASHSVSSTEETALAKSALEALGLRLAAVDIICTPAGYKVLEVNDGIMMENYMRQSADNKNHASEVYESIIDKLF